MRAVIYNPTKSAMQSGYGHSSWILEFSPSPNSMSLDSTMGWTSSSDMMKEVVMRFSSKDLAIKYAMDNNIEYEVIEPIVRKIIKKSYSDNFV